MTQLVTAYFIDSDNNNLGEKQMNKIEFKKIAKQKNISILDVDEIAYVSKNCQINVYKLSDGILVGYKEDSDDIGWGIDWYDEGAPLNYDIVMSNFDYPEINYINKKASVVIQ